MTTLWLNDYQDIIDNEPIVGALEDELRNILVHLLVATAAFDDH